MKPHPTHKVSVRDRLRYSLDNFMARGGTAVFLSLLTMFLLSFIAMALLRLIVGQLWPDPTTTGFFDHLWRTLLEIVDSGNIGEDTDAPMLTKVIGVSTILVGMVLFSTMVAFITTHFEERLERMRRGHSQVIESGHSLLLGFGDRSLDIIRELIIANESERDEAIVILAERDKQEMDELLHRRISDRKTTRIITRTGAPSHLASLENVGVHHARSVTILSESRRGDAEQAVALADARVLKTIMAVIATVGESNAPPIIAELHLEKNRTLAESIAPGRITTLDDATMLSKMLVQTSRVSGLALVYSDIVGFEGNEVYFFRPERGWPARSFGQLAFHFPESVPLGIRTADGQITLNPPVDTRLGAEDELLVLAEDDSTIGYVASPVYEPREMQIPARKLDPTTERHLLVGWTTKSLLMINEYAQYLQPGSTIDVIVSLLTEETREVVQAMTDSYPEINISVREVDMSAPGVLTEVAPETYDNVVILSKDGVSPEEADAQTVSSLLRLRQHFLACEESRGEVVSTQVVTEVMDSEDIELVLQIGVKDYLISNQFLSKIFAQISQAPDVKRVYDELFREEGSEIYLKSADLYFDTLPVTVPFGDCVSAAQARGEVCFGYKRHGVSGRAEDIHVIPDKSTVVTLSSNDSLIVLAEDER